MHDAPHHPVDDAWNEFPPGAFERPGAIERRDFLRLAAASIALANFAGCSRRPPEGIAPHAHDQTGFVPGVPQWFATSVIRRGHGMGVLVRSDDARPTKIEGNPDHPASLGATDAIAQAELLTLYDPARSATITHRGRLADWDAFQGWLRARLDPLRAREGEGLWIVLAPQTSPTMGAAIERLRSQFPRAAFATHDPLDTRAPWEGARSAFGHPLQPVLNLSIAQAVVSLDADFFSAAAPSGVRCANAFADARRKGLRLGALNPSLLVAEPIPTCTGARADHRLAERRSKIPDLARALAAELGVLRESRPLAKDARAWAHIAALALRNAGPAGLLIVGDTQPSELHALGIAINHALGALGSTLRFIEPTTLLPDAFTLDDCAAALDAGAVDTILLIDVNPVYDGLRAARFAESLSRADASIHMGLYRDETALACDWSLPLAHDLERWGDARAFDGSVGVIQPLTQPIYGGRSALWMLNAIVGDHLTSDADAVRTYWRGARPEADWDAWWRSTLRAGVMPETQASFVNVGAPRALTTPAESWPSEPEGAIEVAINPHPFLLDGRHASNAWLQELPDAITQLTWGNAAMLSPELAREVNVTRGEALRLTHEHAAVTLPALPIPGMAPRTIGLFLGGGRRAGGPVALARGVDLAPLRSPGAEFLLSNVCAQPTGATTPLALAQTHDTAEGRDIVRVIEPGAPASAKRTVHLPLYSGPKLAAAQQWGMSIDLASCIGCGACVVACQAENNIPIVGPDEVRRGRRMHWLRVDRYFEEHPDGRADILLQPLACVQCENAPCELVCPTGATQHSNDGLNEMNYARCIGTRYCSNNCPYKVRRFNFFRYADDAESMQRMRNPRVATRGRGVMEKCTYCVQRIRAAEISARIDETLISDGAIRTACEQVCPTNAIVFGDVADPATRVSDAKDDPRAYSLLGHLNTKPRTTYLADVRPRHGGAQ